uniref:Uncharacterized protein n=1 Tax=Steinernema glaseri TaxID=37863 RepID=A0A1I7ZJ81_9BILA
MSSCFHGATRLRQIFASGPGKCNARWAVKMALDYNSQCTTPVQAEVSELDQNETEWSVRVDEDERRRR